MLREFLLSGENYPVPAKWADGKRGKKSPKHCGRVEKKEKEADLKKKKQEKKGISVLGEELAVGNTRQFSIFGHDAVKAELKFTQSGATATTTRYQAL